MWFLSNALTPIEVTEEGIFIFINDEQPKKASRLIDVTDEGCSNDTFSSDEQDKKTPSDIVVIEEGIVICFKEEQL